MLCQAFFATQPTKKVSLNKEEFSNVQGGSMRERPHKHEIELSEEQRFILHQVISSGKAPARQLAHARILLQIDRNAPGPRWTDEQVAEAFEMSRYTVR
jgi:hypothetical protein